VSRLWMALIVVIALGAAIGTLMFKDPGYLLVSYGGAAFETSIWMAVVLLIGFYLLLRCLIWLVRNMRNGFSSVSDWGLRRRVKKAQNMTARGLLLWAEGDWREAQRVLSAGAADSEYPLINHLFAARSAHAMGDAKVRDTHLELAVEAEPGAAFAVNLQRAEFCLATGAYAEASQILKSLRTQAPRHPKVLLDLADCCEKTGEWELQLEVLSVPGLTALIPPEEITRRTEAAWKHILAGGSPEVTWAALPKKLQSNPALVQVVAERLVQTQGSAHAEEIVRIALKHEWTASLIELYGRIGAADVAAQIRHAESWLKQHPNDPDLLLTLGRLYLRNQLTDQAENAFKSALRVRADRAAHTELGRLLVGRGELSRGADHLVQALSTS
jgi:HemY protein